MIMKIIQESDRQRAFHKMMHQVYKSDGNFKDNKSGLFELVCNPKGQFYKNSLQQMISVENEDKVQCQAVLIRHMENPESLCVSFFEALPGAYKEVKQLLNYAATFGHEHNCSRLVIGLEGHCNYGLGFVTECFGVPAFGEAYNPTYYLDYFDACERQRYVSYTDTVVNVSRRVLKYLVKLEKRSNQFQIEPCNFSKNHYISTMKRYTDMNNSIFKGHKNYYYRNYQEDQELFKSMIPILSNENLLFITHEGKDVGFILWYFDYNELVDSSKGAGIQTFIRYKLLRQKPRTIKIVEIGVEKEYRSTPAILLLFNGAMEWGMKSNRHLKTLITSWIYDKNLSSILITSKFAKIPYREYVTYEKEL